jgi:hypothetical protein
VIGNVYAHFASLASNDYTFLGTPTVASLSAFLNYGSATLEYDYTGLVARSIAWDLRGDGQYSTITLDMIGQAVVENNTDRGSISHPADSLLTIPSGLTTFTVNYDGATAVGSLKSAQIAVERSVSGMERQRMGAAILPQPVIGNERPVIRATFNLEMSAATGNNTVALLARWLSGSTLGTITCSDFVLTGCQPVGEFPSLERGFIDHPLQVEATGLVVTTAA